MWIGGINMYSRSNLRSMLHSNLIHYHVPRLLVLSSFSIGTASNECLPEHDANEPRRTRENNPLADDDN